MAAAFLTWLADRGRHLGECTQHDLDEWLGAGPTTRRHVITFLSWARQQCIIRDLDVPVISTEGAEACPPGPDARLAAIRRLLLDETLTPGDRIAGCLVALYGQQPSRIAALRMTDTSCAARHPAQARRGLARRARARCHPAAGTPTQPQQHDHGSQPGLAVAVSRAARRRTSQLPPAHPRASPTWHPCPGEPAGRMARARPASATRSPRRRARRLAGHGDAPRVPRRRRLVRLRRSKTCSHPGRQDVAVGHRDGASRPSALERACNIRLCCGRADRLAVRTAPNGTSWARPARRPVSAAGTFLITPGGGIATSPPVRRRRVCPAARLARSPSWACAKRLMWPRSLAAARPGYWDGGSCPGREDPVTFVPACRFTSRRE